MLPLLSEIVKMNLAFLETKHERGIPFNEAIGSDELGLDIMARGMLQDWTGQMFNQYRPHRRKASSHSGSREDQAESRARFGRSAASAARGQS